MLFVSSACFNASGASQCVITFHQITYSIQTAPRMHVDGWIGFWASTTALLRLPTYLMHTQLSVLSMEHRSRHWEILQLWWTISWLHAGHMLQIDKNRHGRCHSNLFATLSESDCRRL